MIHLCGLTARGDRDRADTDATRDRRTGIIIGTIHNRSVHVPIELATESRKKVDLAGEMWKSVLAVRGQPSFVG